MGYLIAYLLLTLAVDLLRDLVKPASAGGSAATVRRRLWSDSQFDCYSAKVAPHMVRLNGFPQRNRPGFLTAKATACPTPARSLQRPA